MPTTFTSGGRTYFSVAGVVTEITGGAGDAAATSAAGAEAQAQQARAQATGVGAGTQLKATHISALFAAAMSAYFML